MTVGLSVALMVTIGVMGPSAAVVPFAPSPPWPPWFFHTRPSASVVGSLSWGAILFGTAGLTAGLLAARRGWRPSPTKLLVGSLGAAILLTAMPPLASADMLQYYVVSGRIVSVGHNPYLMTPGQLKSSGDPVGSVAVQSDPNQPTRYGPAATAIEGLASALATASVARTVFWLKAWEALAFLALAFGLDRISRSDAAARTRVHLLWSVNPLMLWAVLAGGHNDGLATAAGMAAILIIIRRTHDHSIPSWQAVLAGMVLGLGVAIKVPYTLFGAGLLWACRRSPRAVAALVVGTAFVLVPGYLLAGKTALPATLGLASSAPVGYTPWFAVAWALGLHNATTEIDIFAWTASGVLAIVLLWRLPSGKLGYQPIRITLALALALLLMSPQQRPWYDAMIFPLLAFMPATKLDWIVIARSAAESVASVPRFTSFAHVHQEWVSAVFTMIFAGSIPITLTVLGAVLICLCFTGNWLPATRRGPRPFIR